MYPVTYNFTARCSAVKHCAGRSCGGARRDRVHGRPGRGNRLDHVQVKRHADASPDHCPTPTQPATRASGWGRPRRERLGVEEQQQDQLQHNNMIRFVYYIIIHVFLPGVVGETKNRHPARRWTMPSCAVRGAWRRRRVVAPPPPAYNTVTVTVTAESIAFQ